ncbi:MAG TPA: ABC transporter ATP-binding protein [Nocardioides sp.]|nr:ABC transporter ATP-binding protein [Nocardioides sp.]
MSNLTSVTAPPVTADLTLDRLGVAFGAKTIVEDFSLTINKGEFVTMVGPSGCGKSTTLNAIAGLLSSVPSAKTTGTVTIRDGVSLAYAFQKDALLPWATAQRNVEIGAELGGVPRAQRAERAQELLHHVGLFGIEKQYPHQLSGGMRQRVSLARALAYHPDLFILDEPFGALDAFTRMDLQNKLLELWNETGMTMILVTHDLAEALVLGTKVVVLDAHPGRVHQIVDNTEWGNDRKAEELRSQPEFLEKYRVLFDTLVELSEKSRKKVQA